MIDCAKDRTINITYLEAPIERVWWSIATPEGNNSYLTYTADTTGSPSKPKVGDQFTLCYGDITNHPVVTQCEELNTFTLSDSYQSIAPNGEIDYFDVTTKFLLERKAGLIKLTLEVVGFSDDAHGQWFRECLEMGWRRSLMNLKSVLELGMDLRAEMFSYPRIGVVNCTVNEEQSEKTGVLVEHGNYLMEVFPNSPAELAGLKRGDVIVSFENTPTPNYREFVRVISTYYAKNDPVRIGYVRSGKRHEVTVRLSLEDTFTGLVDLEGTSFDKVKMKREELAKQRSASGSLWKKEKGGR
jgi:hypothetical protein